MSKVPVKRTLEERFWLKVDKNGPFNERLGSCCWNWNAATHPAGYGLLGRGSRKLGLIRATHVSWKIHTGQDVPKDKIITHHCDNPPCTNPEHLALGTHKSNHADMKDRGREILPKPRYALDNNKGKLTDEQVIAIRDRFSKIVLPPRRHGRVKIKQDLADEFGVSITHIKDIIKRKVRKNV